MIMAMPWPPPTHMVSRPICLSCQRSELMSVVVIRAPVMPNGWPTAIAPPLTFSLSHVDAEVGRARDDLRGERLVDLDQVDVVDGHAGPGQCLPGRLDRPVPHDLGGQGGESGGDDPGQRRDAELAGPGVGHDDQRGGAVVERAAVAGGDRAVGAEDRLEPGTPPPA